MNELREKVTGILKEFIPVGAIYCIEDLASEILALFPKMLNEEEIDEIISKCIFTLCDIPDLRERCRFAAQALSGKIVKPSVDVNKTITNSLCNTCKDNDICKDVSIRKSCGAYKPICECEKKRSRR